MQPRTIVERVWPGHAAAVEALGTTTKRNFKVDVGGDSYVLRLGGRDAEVLGLDGRAHHAASAIAADLGVTPEVVAFVEPEGYVVTRYVDAAPIAPARLRERDLLLSLARLLRRVHNSGSITARFDPFRAVEAYHAAAVARGIRIPAGYERAAAIAAMIERLRPPHPQVLCHNDLLNANIIVDAAGRLWIVGWEYAGMGDRFFDLASLSIHHRLDEDEDATLLASYGVDEPRSLVHMQFMALFREAMWGLAHVALGETDYDFAGHADAHFERLQEAADSDRFRRSLL